MGVLEGEDVGAGGREGDRGVGGHQPVREGPELRGHAAGRRGVRGGGRGGGAPSEGWWMMGWDEEWRSGVAMVVTKMTDCGQHRSHESIATSPHSITMAVIIALIKAFVLLNAQGLRMVHGGQVPPMGGAGGGGGGRGVGGKRAAARARSRGATGWRSTVRNCSVPSAGPVPEHRRAAPSNQIRSDHFRCRADAGA